MFCIALLVACSETGEQAPSLSGTAYRITYHVEDLNDEAGARVAQRWNAEPQTVAFVNQSEFVQKQGPYLITGKYRVSGDTLTMGDNIYRVEAVPGGLIWRGESYLTIWAEQQKQ